MPCDNYSRTIVNQTFSDCIDDIECILSDLQCTSFIGDYNTCINKLNAQTTYLTDFIRRNNLTVSWDHQVSNKDNTYNNFSLNHFSSIDHFIIAHNIYDSIISDNVINEVTNPSNHNAILLSFSLNINLAAKVKDNCDLFNSNPLWKRASDNNIQEYAYTLDKFLGEIHIPTDLLLRNYSCISRHFFVPISYPKARVRLIYEVQVFSDIITNCNHKLSSRWSHINAATSGMGGSVW